MPKKKPAVIEYTDPETNEELIYEVVKGEYLNPFNGFVYYDFDEWLEELDLDDHDVFHWIEYEKNPYLIPETDFVVDAYNDYKRGWVDTQYVYRCVDGGYFGFLQREGQNHDWVPTEIEWKSRLKKRGRKKIWWELI